VSGLEQVLPIVAAVRSAPAEEVPLTPVEFSGVDDLIMELAAATHGVEHVLAALAFGTDEERPIAASQLPSVAQDLRRVRQAMDNFPVAHLAAEIAEKFASGASAADKLLGRVGKALATLSLAGT